MMTNWLVSIIRKSTPFEKKEVIIHAVSIQEAFDQAEKEHKDFHVRSATFHSVNTDQFVPNQSAFDEAVGWGWGK
jgi:hypothetical protein